MEQQQLEETKEIEDWKSKDQVVDPAKDNNSSRRRRRWKHKIDTIQYESISIEADYRQKGKIDVTRAGRKYERGVGRGRIIIAIYEETYLILGLGNPYTAVGGQKKCCE